MLYPCSLLLASGEHASAPLSRAAEEDSVSAVQGMSGGSFVLASGAYKAGGSSLPPQSPSGSYLGSLRWNIGCLLQDKRWGMLRLHTGAFRPRCSPWCCNWFSEEKGCPNSFSSLLLPELSAHPFCQWAGWLCAPSKACPPATPCFTTHMTSKWAVW